MKLLKAKFILFKKLLISIATSPCSSEKLCQFIPPSSVWCLFVKKTAVVGSLLHKESYFLFIKNLSNILSSSFCILLLISEFQNHNCVRFIFTLPWTFCWKQFIASPWKKIVFTQKLWTHLKAIYICWKRKRYFLTNTMSGTLVDAWETQGVILKGLTFSAGET